MLINDSCLWWRFVQPSLSVHLWIIIILMAQSAPVSPRKCSRTSDENGIIRSHFHNYGKENGSIKTWVLSACHVATKKKQRLFQRECGLSLVALCTLVYRGRGTSFLFLCLLYGRRRHVLTCKRLALMHGVVYSLPICDNDSAGRVLILRVTARALSLR